ncbi:putative Arf-GAP with SH3 domain ANK repeat and PH domain-containing protein, partial [Naja naja]
NVMNQLQTQIPD